MGCLYTNERKTRDEVWAGRCPCQSLEWQPPLYESTNCYHHNERNPVEHRQLVGQRRQRKIRVNWANHFGYLNNNFKLHEFHFDPQLLLFFWDAGMAQWWEHSLPTNVARVRFPDPASYVGWVCWFSALHLEVFSGCSGFPSPQKPAFDLIWFVLIIHFSLQCLQLVLQH